MLDEDKLSEESQRLISKALRRTIKNPAKLCSWCMNESVHQTPDALMLCEECHNEYCNLKNK